MTRRRTPRRLVRRSGAGPLYRRCKRGAAAATMGVAGALAGSTEAQQWKEAAGITDDFVKQVGAMVQDEQSAIFALATVSVPPAAHELAQRS